MGLEGEGGVKDDTEVADLGGWGDSGAVNSEGEVVGGAGEGVWANDEDFGFIAVELEKVCLHPGFYFSQAGGEGGVGGGSDGFAGEIQLGVIGITVKVKAVGAEYVTKGEHVQNE